MKQDDRIKASFKKKTSDSRKRGTRRVVDVTFNLTEIQSGQDLYVKLATLLMNHVLIPGSRYLTFDFKNGNTESFHQPNLKSTLFKQITHKFNGEIYRDLNEAHVYKCYEDLWSKSGRIGKVDQGLGGTTNLAKLRCKDASASGSNANDNSLNAVYGIRFKDIDDDFLSENGAVYAFALANTHETILKVNSPGKVLVPGGSGKAVPSSFKLENIKMRYETIDNEPLAMEVESNYNSGKSGYYEHVTLVKTFPVVTATTKIHENINLPRKSMRSIVLLFKRATDNSESYYYPNIESVKISFQGQPNFLYSQSMKKYDFYGEASIVFFPSDNTNDKNVSEDNFFTNRFTFVIDLSSTGLRDIQGQGAKLTDSQNGVLLEITKLAPSASVCTCYMYVVSDGLLNINNAMLQSIQY